MRLVNIHVEISSRYLDIWVWSCKERSELEIGMYTEHRDGIKAMREDEVI